MNRRQSEGVSLSGLEYLVSEEIDRLSKFTSTDEGVTRLPFTRENRLALEYLAKRLNEVGKRVYVDRMGNILTSSGRESRRDDKVVFCSHYDSVPNGGKYDGTAGVVFGILLLSLLGKAEAERIELCAFNCEESSLFGRASLGSAFFLKGKEALGDYETLIGERVSLTKLIEEADFQSFSQVEKPSVEEGTRFIEIHVDQSKELSKKALDLAFVEKIAGQRRLSFTFKGETNHSSLMNLSARRDSLLASTSAILKASELSKLMSSDEVVGTVTRLVNTPNVMNMIPGETETTVDIRGFSVRSLEEFKGSLTDYCRAVSEGAAIEFSSSELSTMDPATMDIALLEYLQNSLTVKGLSSTRMHSIAWHDIAEVSKYFASSLILLPNPTGVSHSPREAMDLTSFSKLLNAMLEIFGGSHASN